jgi:regulator of protease activity HflC (stomatin/prohibitin superfamily)
MFGIKRWVIAAHERGLLFHNRELNQILEPGVHWRWDPFNRTVLRVFDTTEGSCTHPQADVLVTTAPERTADHLHRVEMGAHQVGMIYRDGIVSDVLPPGTRKVFWHGPVRIDVGVQDLTEAFEAPPDVVAQVVQPGKGRATRVWDEALVSAEIAAEHEGLVFVDGALFRTLGPGRYAFWRFNRHITIESVDTRLQPMEVNGQEIVTRDKVSLRVNLTADYRVTDAVQARTHLSDPVAWLYRRLQLALRQAIGERTLDALLADKEHLNQVVFQAVAAPAAAHGLELVEAGAKDFILPGEMKDILNQVVMADKEAQANVIRRREETAATRSLLNTAKLMDENPTLLRLKELEILEKVTEKIDRLTVYGGLEGILKDTVRVNIPMDTAH